MSPDPTERATETTTPLPAAVPAEASAAEGSPAPAPSQPAPAPSGGRGVVVEKLPPVWEKGDVEGFFSERCGGDGCVERVTHVPRKALALLTFASDAAAEAAVALSGAEVEGTALAVSYTDRTANGGKGGKKGGTQQGRKRKRGGRGERTVDVCSIHPLFPPFF